MRRRDSLARGKPSREPYPAWLIVCEGTVTERLYFSDLRHLKHVALTLEFIAGGVPLTLVQKAAAAIGSSSDFDEIWVVFDVDEHPNVPEAIRQAERNKLKMAI
jgi:hypothetical protein